jgi:hypothetical protein
MDFSINKYKFTNMAKEAISSHLRLFRLQKGSKKLGIPTICENEELYYHKHSHLQFEGLSKLVSTKFLVIAETTRASCLTSETRKEPSSIQRKHNYVPSLDTRKILALGVFQD